MDTLQAFAMGEAHRDCEPMVFDWDHAAELIRESGAAYAAAGLRSDWEWTGGTIFSDGEIIQDEYTFLASTWAVPELDLDGKICPCYRMQSETPRWDASTKWPESAIRILMGED